MAASSSSTLKLICNLLTFCCFIGLFSCDEVDRCPSNLKKDKYLRVHGGKCYRFNTRETSWPSALSSCRRSGGELITITRRDIQIFVERTLNEIWHNNGMWIGAHDRDSEMDWFWVTGEKVRSNFQNWDRGQPSCFLLDFMCHEDCACLRMDDGYKWHDYLCSSSLYEYGYACQYNLLPPPKTTTTTSTTTNATTTTTSTTTSSTKMTTTLPTKRPTRTKTTQKEEQTTKKSTEKTTTTHKSSNGTYITVGTAPDNLVNIQSQLLSKDESGLKTGGMVGLVVSFVLVFIAGLIVGVFVCRRRYRKRYEESMNLGFNNVLYTAAPAQETRVKDINVMTAADDGVSDEEVDHKYTDIDEIACGGRYVDIPGCKDTKDTPLHVACLKENVYDTVTSHGEAGPPENTGGACSDDAPPPCPGRNLVQFAPEFLKKDTDVSEAYSNNLYGYST